MRAADTATQKLLRFTPYPLRSGSLLLASAFERNSMALAAGAFEFIILSSSPVETVAGLAQRCPLQAWLSLVVNHQRLVRVRAAGNRCNLHLGNIARCAADCLPDLAEGVQIFEFDGYLLQLGRLAHPGKRGTGEQLAQRLSLFRACAGIDIVSN